MSNFYSIPILSAVFVPLYLPLTRIMFSLFRPSGESTMTKLFNKASMKRKDVEHLWSFSKDALKKPLLKKTISRDDIRKLACHCFTYILASAQHQFSSLISPYLQAGVSLPLLYPCHITISVLLFSLILDQGSATRGSFIALMRVLVALEKKINVYLIKMYFINSLVFKTPVAWGRLARKKL